jgi:hypothetical protein
MGNDICLVCTGYMNDRRNKTYINEIKEFIQINKLHKYIRLLGLVDYEDVFALIKFSEAVINPSLFEGWSSTVEECKSVKKHMILSDLWYVEDNKDNFIFGTSQILSLEEATRIARSELLAADYIVGHAIEGDLKWLRSLGVSVDTSKLLDSQVVAAGIDYAYATTASPSELSASSSATPLSTLSTASPAPPSPLQWSLKRLILHMQRVQRGESTWEEIKASDALHPLSKRNKKKNSGVLHLHNGANDAAWTMAVLLSICGRDDALDATMLGCGGAAAAAAGHRGRGRGGGTSSRPAAHLREGAAIFTPPAAAAAAAATAAAAAPATAAPSDGVMRFGPSGRKRRGLRQPKAT